MSDTSSQDTSANPEFQLVLEDDFEETVYTCNICRCSSGYTAGFQVRQRKSQEPQITCNTCAAYKRANKSKSGGRFELIAVILLFIYAATSDGIAEILSFLIKYVSLSYLAIVVHEFGHYIVTVSLGVKVRLMSLGTGPVLKVFRLRQMFIVLKPFPSGGSVHPEFESANHVRSKLFLIVLAGPAFNLLMSIASAAVLFYFQDQISSFAADVLLVWAIVNAIAGVTNLIPFRIKNVAGVVQSDGAYLLQLPFWKNEEIEKLVVENQVLVAQMELQFGDRLVARALASEAIKSGRNANINGAVLTISAITRNELAMAVEMNQQLVENIDQEDEITAMLRNNLAYALFRVGEPAGIAQANRQSLKAMEILPMSLAVRSTRGSVLVSMGEYEQGLALLEDERFSLESVENQASVLCVRALAYDALNRRDHAEECRRKAKLFDPSCILLNDVIDSHSNNIAKAF